MAFDPSIISQIPDAAPNPVKALSNTYTLKDMVNRNKFNELELNAKKSQLADAEKARNILKDADYTNPESLTKTASKLTQAGLPNQAMELMKMGQQYQSGEIEMQRQKLELADQQQGAVVSAIDPIVAQLEDLKNKGATPAMLDAKAKQLGIATMQQLAQSRPDLGPMIQKFAQNPQALTYNGLKAAEMQSKQGQAMIRSRLDEIRVDVDRRKQEETERHNKAMESNAEKKQAGFTDDQRSLLAEMAVRNVNLPAGLRSQQQIKATLDGLIEKNPDKSPAQIADDIKSGKLKLAAETKGAQTAGTQIGKVALSANELDTFGDQTLQASSDVPRGKFVPWNKLSQMSETQISDPKLLRFKTKMQALENAYNQLASRSGTDVEKRAHIHELFMTANSDEAVKTLVKSLKEEASGAREAANRTIAETSEKAIPGAGGETSQPSGGWKIEQVQ
jgi:hypothetical protein